jgi:hypothetical protein
MPSLHHPPTNAEAKDAIIAVQPLGPPASILRRGSTSASSDGGSDAVGFGLGMMGVPHPAPGHEGKLGKVEEKRERIEWADEVMGAEVSLQFISCPFNVGASY